MSNVSNLEQKITNLNINHGSSSSPQNSEKIAKKVGPAVPPKPKKSEPQVPQSYTIKAATVPSYSTVLNNSGNGEKSTNLYANSLQAPYCREPSEKHVSPTSQGLVAVVGIGEKFYKNNENFYQNNDEGLYTNDKNFYCNFGNIPTPQVLPTVEQQQQQQQQQDRSNRATRNAVYSNIEPAIPIPVPTPIASKEKDIIYSNIQWNNKPENTYSNIPNHDDLPPPPSGPSEYISCVPGSFPPPPEELPPPPSPVSSSYSELRRATYDQHDDYPSSHYPDLYGPSSQSSSTYESIYEPINPRPPSQLSCNYSMYSGYGSANSSQPPPPSLNKVSPAKEVDTLTDLLVQGMEDNQDDIYGICAQCGEKVEGEGSGCSAMDKVFHIDCFSCFVCQVNLQGKPFYSLENKPYCEEDYLNTLEKCCVCTRPILDRILRATGKPYHPSCFTCVVCGQSLDGIPFTVDATNQIHCIQCFHKKFAPRCCVCKLPIMPEPGQDETVRVVALDRSFHIQCYKCEDCGLVLSSDAEDSGCYPLDDHVLCKSCNAKRVQALTSHMITEL